MACHTTRNPTPDYVSAGRALGALIVLLSTVSLVAAQAAPPAVPALQFREASGCGGLLLYTWNEARTEVLVIRIDQSRVTIKNGSTDLEIGPANSAVTADLEVTETPRETFPYCDEGAKATDRPVTWKVLSGRLKLIVKRRPGSFTPVSVGVERLVAQAPDGRQVKQRRDVQFTAAVGDLQ